MEENALIPTNTYPDMGYKFEFFNPFQSKFYPEAAKDTNVVVSAPTGAGKTVVAEMGVYEHVVKGEGRAIFLGPMRALAQEKFDDWSDDEHPFSKYGVSILTGDFKLTENKKKELNASRIILMTSEMLDSRSRRMKSEGNKWLMECEILIVDESHIIGMWNDGAEPLQERGHRLEAALMRFSNLNPKCRIVLLSATLPNLPELGQWLTKLNNKETNIIVSDFTPQPVEWHMETYPETIGRGSYHINKANSINKAIEVISANKNDMWLVFVHSKTDGRQIQQKLENELEVSVPFHSADLEKTQRREIEENFKSKNKQIIIATSTLAYGMNLPARRVLILDSLRGIRKVHPYDIKQMGGRAGRPGIDPRGDVHWIIGDRSKQFCENSIKTLPKASSLMNDIDVFSFHIVAEIAEGSITTKKEVWEYYNKCLANHQGANVTENWIDQLVTILINHQAITVDENQNLKVTQLGKIASWLYFSPFDIFHWYSNFHTLFQTQNPNDAQCVWAWGAIRSNSMEYIPKDCIQDVDDYRMLLRNIGSLRGADTHCMALYKQIISAEPDDIPSGCIPIKRALVFDLERHAQAILLIDNMYGRWGKSEFIKKLALRIQHGCSWEAAELCTIPRIGKRRADDLISNGIKTPTDILEKRKVVKAILGPKTFEIVFSYVEEKYGEATNG